MRNNNGSILGLFFGAWFIWVLAALAFWGVIGYVAWHFISKFW